MAVTPGVRLRVLRDRPVARVHNPGLRNPCRRVERPPDFAVVVTGRSCRLDQQHAPNVLVGMAVYAVVPVRFAYRLVTMTQAATSEAERFDSSSTGGNSSLEQYGEDPWAAGAFLLLGGP